MVETNVDMGTQWRTAADEANPAGPLFESGALTVADIIEDARINTGCSLCTGSIRVHCCA